jgi:hypothetical protein
MSSAAVFCPQRLRKVLPTKGGTRPDFLAVMGWVQLLQNAGFESIDILLRDAEKVVLAALKPW